MNKLQRSYIFLLIKFTGSYLENIPTVHSVSKKVSTCCTYNKIKFRIGYRPMDKNEIITFSRIWL